MKNQTGKLGIVLSALAIAAALIAPPSTAHALSTDPILGLYIFMLMFFAGLLWPMAIYLANEYLYKSSLGSVAFEKRQRRAGLALGVIMITTEAVLVAVLDPGAAIVLTVFMFAILFPALIVVGTLILLIADVFAMAVKDGYYNKRRFAVSVLLGSLLGFAIMLPGDGSNWTKHGLQWAGYLSALAVLWIALTGAALETKDTLKAVFS